MAQRVAIVGGGAVGSSIAYFLASHPRFRGEVVVVERDPSYRYASSALSASAIRQQFSTPVNIDISRFGLEFLRRLGDHLAVGDERPDVGLSEPGYLFLATPAGVPILEQNHRVQREHEVDVALLTPAGVAERFPWMNVEGVAAASLGLSGEGWFDGYALLQAFRRKAQALGVTYVAQAAAGFTRTGRRPVGAPSRRHAGHRSAGARAPPLRVPVRVPHGAPRLPACDRSLRRLVP